MEKEKRYQQIEDYLEGKLPEQERLAFERELEASPDLKKELRLHRELSENLGGLAFHKFRKVVTQADASWEMPTGKISKGKVRNIHIWKYAAGMAATILFGFFIWTAIQQPPAPKDLFAAHFQAYEMVLSQRTANPAQSELLESAVFHYSKGQFPESEALFAELASQYPEQPIYLFYEAISSLAAGNPEPAISHLQKLIAEPNLEQQARWYLSLAYLKREDASQAREMLMSIMPGTYRFDQAQVILKKLN